MADPAVQNIAVGLTIMCIGALLNTGESNPRHARAWIAARGIVAVVAFASLYVAAQRFGPDGSRKALGIAFLVLWVPQLLLAFLTEPRQWGRDTEEAADQPGN